ncbi:DUF1330 domain-containing protein [Aromatoleum diolicum]|uniref:DUF1330 domain-containing protein n=1 Tax=Aromatoleum diolicum TaxID=75796 RepID=A0ABX1QAK3_9RHOO|nr:DUF1330 domain-containing protein [Aromatoleum diolicum]NMG74140.1 DUF1330 domain-containing protein [Aromatoleum diolicum]
MTPKNPAYAIGHITIKDAEKWAEYCLRVPGTLSGWGGELVFRGSRVAVLGGEHAHTDTVVVRFPDVDAVNGWFNSAEYQALIPLREQAADVVLIAYES